jgi:hypothetical protein
MLIDGHPFFSFELCMKPLELHKALPVDVDFNIRMTFELSSKND